jgi:hypothetical protein
LAITALATCRDFRPERERERDSSPQWPHMVRSREMNSHEIIVPIMQLPFCPKLLSFTLLILIIHKGEEKYIFEVLRL